ncbi:MAG: MarR family winged helix-turn-helix transcriptional regulator [Nannocystaceae bacterium]
MTGRGGSTPPRLDEQLCFAVYAANRAITRAYAPMLSEVGLTYPQFLVMMALWEEDDRTVSAIGQRLGLDSGTLTPLLKRLERAGFVRRRRDRADERRVRLTLTAAGRELGPRAAKAQRALVCRFGGAPGIEALREALWSLTDRIAAVAE